MTAPRWTPEQIAALAEGLVEGATERARLQEIVATDPEAKALFHALREDADALGAAFDSHLAGDDRAFQRAVERRLAEAQTRERRARRFQQWGIAAAAVVLGIASVILTRPDGREPIDLSAPERFNGAELAPEGEALSSASETRPLPQWVVEENAIDRSLGTFNASMPRVSAQEIVERPRTLRLAAHEVRTFTYSEAEEPFVIVADAGVITGTEAELWANAAFPGALVVEVRRGQARLATVHGEFLDLTAGQSAAVTEDRTVMLGDPMRAVALAAGTGPSGPAMRRAAVTDADGHPIAEALLALRVHMRRGEGWVFQTIDLTATDFEGAAELSWHRALIGLRQRGLHSRALFLQASAPGFAAQEVEVSDWPASREVTLALPTARTLAGQVLGTDGAPLADAAVSVREAQGGTVRQGVQTATTDAAGQFHFRHLTAEPQTLMLRTETGALRLAVAVPAASQEITVRVPDLPPTTLTGTVRGVVTGRPLAGVEVQIEETGNHLGAGSLSRRHTVTDAEGRFAFDHLRPGIPHRAEVAYHTSLDDSDPWKAEGITLTGEAPSREIELVAVEPFTFTATVVSAESGAPIPAVGLRVDGEERVHLTDFNGQTSIDVEVWEGMIQLGLEVVSPDWQAQETDTFGRVWVPLFEGEDPAAFTLPLVPR